jgi:hypothetical protein
MGERLRKIVLLLAIGLILPWVSSAQSPPSEQRRVAAGGLNLTFDRLPVDIEAAWSDLHVSHSDLGGAPYLAYRPSHVRIYLDEADHVWRRRDLVETAEHTGSGSKAKFFAPAGPDTYYDPYADSFFYLKGGQMYTKWLNAPTELSGPWEVWQVSPDCMVVVWGGKRRFVVTKKGDAGVSELALPKKLGGETLYGGQLTPKLLLADENRTEIYSLDLVSKIVSSLDFLDDRPIASGQPLVRNIGETIAGTATFVETPFHERKKAKYAGSMLYVVTDKGLVPVFKELVQADKSGFENVGSSTLYWTLSSSNGEATIYSLGADGHVLSKTVSSGFPKCCVPPFLSCESGNNLYDPIHKRFYDPSRDTWLEVPDMPESGNVESRIVIMGGGLFMGGCRNEVFFKSSSEAIGLQQCIDVLKSRQALEYKYKAPLLERYQNGQWTRIVDLVELASTVFPEPHGLTWNLVKVLEDSSFYHSGTAYVCFQRLGKGHGVVDMVIVGIPVTEPTSGRLFPQRRRN